MDKIIILYIVLGVIIITALVFVLIYFINPSAIVPSNGQGNGSDATEDPALDADAYITIVNRAETVNVTGCRYTYVTLEGATPVALLFEIQSVSPPKDATKFSTIINTAIESQGFYVEVDLYKIPVKGTYLLKIPSFYYGCVNGSSSTIKLTWVISDENFNNQSVWYSKEMGNGEGTFPAAEGGARVIDANKVVWCQIYGTSDYVFVKPSFTIYYWEIK